MPLLMWCTARLCSCTWKNGTVIIMSSRHTGCFALEEEYSSIILVYVRKKGGQCLRLTGLLMQLNARRISANLQHHRKSKPISRKPALNLSGLSKISYGFMGGELSDQASHYGRFELYHDYTIQLQKCVQWKHTRGLVGSPKCQEFVIPNVSVLYSE